MPVTLAISVLAFQVFLQFINLCSACWQTMAKLLDDQPVANALIALRVVVELSDPQQVLEVSLPNLLSPSWTGKI
jgi:hypothetical protein